MKNNNQQMIDLALKNQRQALSKLELLKGIEGVDQSIINSCQNMVSQLELGNHNAATIMANDLQERLKKIEKDATSSK